MNYRIQSFFGIIILIQDAEKLEFAEDKKTIMTDLVLTYVRLGLSFNMLGDQVKYQEKINSAIDLSKQYCRDDWHTEEALVSIVTKLDDSNRKNLNP